MDLTEDQVDSSDGQSESQGIDFASRTGLQEAAKRLRDSSQEHPVPAFHWEIEFPEVFSRENGGFDAFVGNPPFLGGRKVWPVLGEAYRDWMQTIHEDTGGKAVDLVAHFFRRTFSLLREHGTFGLITTNSIAQGDTRNAGLQPICRKGGFIYAATRRLRWPGEAAVVVSVVHLSRGQIVGGSNVLDGKAVSKITAFLGPSR